MKGPFYIRRTNAVGNAFCLGERGEWHVDWNSGIGGYKVHTYKTPKGAAKEADRFAKAYPGHSVSVMTDSGGTRPVETFSYPVEVTK